MTVAATSVRVARSEDELIKLARGLVGAGRPPSRARAATPITQIGPTAMALLQQTLARGVPLALLRAGGWETRRTLVGGQVVRGRLWDRHRVLPPLEFGPASFAMLTWLHREDLIRPSAPLARAAQVSVGDEVLHYLACEQLVRAGVELRQPAFVESPLCQLAFPDLLVGDDQPLPPVDFTPFVTGAGAIVVEALQRSLAARWVAAERSKGTIVSLAEMTRLGRAQRQVLDAWITALERPQRDQPAGRRDLAGFVAEAARELLARGPERRCPDHRWWIRSLSVHAPLSQRQAAFSSAAALLRGVGRLGAWLDEAGLVAHFDEDYAAAQLLLSSWQFLRERPPATIVRGEPPSSLPLAILDRAASLAHTLESLHSLGIDPPGPP